MMKTGNKGVRLIKEFEGLRLKAYWCSSGTWTIGYGHTKQVEPGMVITAEEAEQLLYADLDPVELVINRECPGLNQEQFDALVSFVYNVGEGAFRRSTLLKYIKKDATDPGIRQEWLRWNKSGGMALAGLLRRRQAEVNVYFEESEKE